MPEVRIDLGDGVVLHADLTDPAGQASGLVVFVHGSGSSRLSPRNRHVARLLEERGLRTLVLDLLTPAEETIDLRTRQHRFDIGHLAHRVIGVLDWLGARSAMVAVPIGLFGASTGAAAALVAAARRPDVVAAVVSRGGRPDLAGDYLAEVRSPTLFVVGENDDTVLGLNETARERLGGISSLEVVPGATHLFEEPGALDIVADLTGDWFERHLAKE